MKSIEIKDLKKKFLPFYKNKRILITGGTGLIGRELVNFLEKCKTKKIIIVSLDKIKIKKRNVKFIYGDLCNLNFCKKITKNIDIVFHLAGIKGSIQVTLDKPASFLVPLLMMNTNILEASRLNKVKRMVYTSSIGAYSKGSLLKENQKFTNEPMDMFPGHAKRMAELQISAYKKQYKLMNYFIVRPCNVFGPGDNFDEKNAMVIPSLMNKIIKGRGSIKVWGDGKSIRDFAFSRDVARAILLTCIKGTGKFDFLNLGSGKGISIKNLVNTLKKVISFKAIYQVKKNTGYSKRVLDMKNSKNVLNFKPYYTLEDGLNETWKWFNKNQHQTKKRKNYFNEQK
ncbi:NAD-dependent epimerase/dehydratase family protein [Candidatus Pelagibacter sp.]|jgi:GDP-L-fucose synthase|nr:NAD-dependent epimerase/dehydratase family protein [Candidatus Pelagibacter sp.]